MVRDRLTPTEQTLFAELVQQVQTAAPAGSVYARGARWHWLSLCQDSRSALSASIRSSERSGDAKAETAVTELKRGMEQARERRRLVSLLRRAGLAAPYKVIAQRWMPSRMPGFSRTAQSSSERRPT